MSSTIERFDQLALSAPLLSILEEIGYETPSPIQAEAIPVLLEGHDLLGQAQTGTGKTAAFALPLLTRVDVNNRNPQILVLAPTRELAIQVSEAFQTYARHMKGFHVLPVYGGQSMQIQLRQLARGAHVIVGTPGRVMDHIRRKTLKLDQLQALVLDEADEMLRMGFIDDVEWILEHTPPQRQIALFSATMPAVIRKVAQAHLNNPTEIKIKTRTSTVETIDQKFWRVTGTNKLDALTRILEVETYDAALIFVRTKTATTELAEKLEARGHASAALNGDISQDQREKTIERLKKGQFDILVATDVAARGLDVKRISHVINYDIPNDPEVYVHRIGRTGRAGATGKAILFVAPREMRMLSAIEKTTRQKIEQIQLPSASAVTDHRVSQFKQSVLNTIESHNLDFFVEIATQLSEEHGLTAEQVAAALIYQAQKDRPLQLSDRSPVKHTKAEPSSSSTPAPRRKAATTTTRDTTHEPRTPETIDLEPLPLRAHPELDMVRFKIEVGHNHGVTPGDIVGAIANEAGIDSQYIGHIQLGDDFSTVDLPDGMPKEIFEHLKRVRVRQNPLNIQPVKGKASAPGSKPPRRSAKSTTTLSTKPAAKKARASVSKEKGKRRTSTK
jgi:ATP-dependent RNA helicase DeaD